MQLITNDSESLFIDFLERIQTNPDSWMCVHVQMASFNSQIVAAEGLSSKTMEKLHQVSCQMASKMHELALGPLDGGIYVFADGDIVAVFSCDTHSYEQIVTKLRQIFESQGLGQLFSNYPMKEKLATAQALSKIKVVSAKEHILKKQRMVAVDAVFALTEPDRNQQMALQTKRRLNPAMTALVIEDDMMSRSLVTAVLKKHCTVIQAPDGKSGIAAYLEHSPNIVFLDIHLPDHNGKEVLEKIKFIDSKPYVVMLSADSVADNIISTHMKGAVGFIAKPFSKEKVLEYIKKCLNKEDDLAAWGWGKKPNQ